MKFSKFYPPFISPQYLPSFLLPPHSPLFFSPPSHLLFSFVPKSHFFAGIFQVFFLPTEQKCQIIIYQYYFCIRNNLGTKYKVNKVPEIQD